MKALIRYHSDGSGRLNIKRAMFGSTIKVSYSNYKPYITKITTECNSIYIPRKFAGKRVEIDFI